MLIIRRNPPASMCNCPHRLERAVLLLVVCGLATLAPTPPARAQTGLGVSYDAGVAALYSGSYQTALDRFSSATRVKTVDSLWIDSICIDAMLGETFYQMGRNKEALDKYNSALQWLVAYPDWMTRIQLPPDLGASIKQPRAVPWGQTARTAPLANLSDTMLVGVGKILTVDDVRRGGVLTPPMYFPINAQEVVRCAALALRRRAELLGPLAKHDPLTDKFLAALNGTPAAADPWIGTWVNLELGAAYLSTGDLVLADNHLKAAVLAGDRAHHRLSCVALLELGKLAMRSGKFQAAAAHFLDASVFASQYQDFGVIDEALQYGQRNHLMSAAGGLYDPLDAATEWARREKIWPLAARFSILAAEELLSVGRTSDAESRLKVATGYLARGDGRNIPLTAQLNFLTAMAGLQKGNSVAAAQPLAAALAQQQSTSVGRFQITLTNSDFTSGAITSRTASEIYSQLLVDPTPAQWANDPLEALAVIVDPLAPAFDRWFTAALDQVDYDQAMLAADLAKRRRFLATQPLGGRPLALRWIFSAPEDALTHQAILQRQEIVARNPGFVPLIQKSDAVRGDLAALAPLAGADAARAQRDKERLWDDLVQASAAEEAALVNLSLTRIPTDLAFPPVATVDSIRQQLLPGQAVLAFHAAGGRLYAMMFAKQDYTVWEIQAPDELYAAIAALLRELGNSGANHELSLKDIQSDAWVDASRAVSQRIFQGSRVTFSGGVNELIVVPDKFLWYLPFEALVTGDKDKDDAPLISRVRVRYSPTMSLALAGRHVRRPTQTTTVLLDKLHPKDDESLADQAFDRISRVAPGSRAFRAPWTRLTPLETYLSDTLIVWDDLDGTSDIGGIPLPVTTGAARSWSTLPWGRPQLVVLPGYHTAAELGLRRGGDLGDEVFLSMCELLAGGTQTALVSRWPTGGETAMNLVREFIQETPYLSPSDAWQRSVQLARAQPVVADHEPRLDHADPVRLPTASHPFFWAGYMLVDTGDAHEAAAADGDQQPAQPGNEVRMEINEGGNPPRPGELVRPLEMSPEPPPSNPAVAPGPNSNETPTSDPPLLPFPETAPGQ